MDKEQEINDYLEEFMRFYYDKNPLLFKNLRIIYNIACLLLEETEDFIINYERYVDYEKRTDMNIEEKIMLLKSFYKSLDIDMPVDKLLNDGTIDFNVIDEIEENDYTLGFCGYNAEDHNHFEVIIKETGKITDLFYLVHELAHYSNLQTPRSETNLMFSESISYLMELLLADFLDKQGFTYDAASYIAETFQTIYNFTSEAFFALKVCIVYDELGSVSAENFKMMFNSDEDYDAAINSFYHSLDKDITALFMLVHYEIAMALSSYMYIQYQKDPNFIKNIMKFNESIQTKDITDALYDIDLTGYNDESIAKVKDALNDFMDEINAGNDNTLGKIAEINDYLISLVNLFKDNDELFKRINDIVFIDDIIIENLKPFFKDNYPNPELDKLSKATVKEKNDILKDYFKYMGYDIDYNASQKHMIITDLTKEDFSDPSYLVSASLTGHNIDEDGENKIYVNNTGYLLDVCAWVHEIKHYQNYPNHERNNTSHILTECISFTEELIMADYLGKIGYPYESAFLKFETLNNFYIFALDSYPINKLLSVFENKGEVSKENYFELYLEDDDFEDVIDNALRLFDTDTDNFRDGIRYAVSTLISIYMYVEYQKDPSFNSKIKKLEENINEKSLDDCLKIIGLSGLDKYSLDKVVTNLNIFKRELLKFYSQKQVNLYSFKYQKVI